MEINMKRAERDIARFLKDNRQLVSAIKGTIKDTDECNKTLLLLAAWYSDPSQNKKHF